MKRTKAGAAAVVAAAAGVVWSVVGVGVVVAEPPDAGQEAGQEREAGRKEATAPMVDPKALERLHADEGVWDATVRFWFQPGAEVVETKVTMTSRVVLDGMYLETTMEGGTFGPAMGDRKWRSVSFTGYNPTSGEYEAVRMSTTTSTMIVVRGKEKDGRLEMTGEYMMAGMKCTHRDVITHPGPDERKIESFMKFGDMPEFKGAEIVAVRAKDGPVATPPAR